MECFRQIFRCIKAPFTREKPRVLEIGPPTNFRKEELPACFSDAESVLSPSQNPVEQPILTKEQQHIDVSGQPRGNDGEERDDDRDSFVSAVSQRQDSEPCLTEEHEAHTVGFRDRLKPSLWFKKTKVDAP
ncbi:hypothetical protein N7532_005213 [Penicillium argentinense]|uniref:Uncharacterized protein n=1 Tax=Penicillium argentinense TaxID=1131581 RepID=A0A9W9FE24_9EURO|nr:uncharacterized protein N7532_005213 [Penicillium argentinense]KAJ5098212.1 hypothetical protein N7532_005213 [Penicillium argentinense]